MEKEFNLSNYIRKEVYSNYPRLVINEQFVKEFIKRLKEELKYFEEQTGYLDYNAFKVRIDKLAGNKLK